MKNKILGGFFGAAIGDALGVPVEFKSRDYLKENPITDFEGYGCWNQPPGTFSDDSSLLFCTAESLCNGYNLEDIGKLFVKWYKEGYWGAHDELFDIGRTTRLSLERIYNGYSAKVSGEFEINSNGNGSLMRILPMVFYLKDVEDISVRFNKIKDVSSVTHAHFRSFFSCFIYCEYARLLLIEDDRIEAYREMQEIVNDFAIVSNFNAKELALFDKLLRNNIWEVDGLQISSLGYVLDSLEASFWSFLTTESYKEAVLKAVNLGGDTDTTGAITGGLSGLYYGIEGIEEKWIKTFAKSDEIIYLAKQFLTSLQPKVE